MNCHLCGKETMPTQAGRYRQHKVLDTKLPCPASGTIVPGMEPPELPGVEEYAEGLVEAAPEPFFRRASRPTRTKAERIPMTEHGQEIATRVKEIFYSYGQRRTSDNRSAQSTLGPSEIGSPCERRLAMSLLRCPPVNPGGDGWAAFKGTCIHAGLAEMFVWASGDSGRFLVEQTLVFPHELVPHGTGDLLDRVLKTATDHKIQGRWSLEQLSTKGPGDTYRTQVHVYAYGHRLAGEDVQRVAIIAWPMESSSLDDLYVWEEPYDPAVAREAFARMDRIKADIDDGCTALDFPVADDCKYCPYHLPGASSIERGCNGR